MVLGFAEAAIAGTKVVDLVKETGGEYMMAGLLGDIVVVWVEGITEGILVMGLVGDVMVGLDERGILVVG